MMSGISGFLFIFADEIKHDSVMAKTKKQFKDFDISDFEDMGSLPKLPKTNTAHRTSIPFIKSVKGASKPFPKQYLVSNLSDVI